MATVREEMAEALEAVLTPCPPENHIVGADGVCPECDVEVQARLALDRHRAEPKTHHREDLLVALDELFQGFQKSPDAQGHDDYWNIDPDAWKTAEAAFKAAQSELSCPDGCDTSCRCYQEGLEAQRERVGGGRA